MESLHIVSKGTLQRKENTLYFIKNEKEKIPIPIEKIMEIYFYDTVTISSQALHLISQKGIVLHFFNHYGYYDGSFYPKETLISGEVIVRQAEHYLNKNKRLALAKSFVEGSLKNIAVNLRTSLNTDLNIDYFSSRISVSKDIPELMSVEGELRKEYYSTIDKKIKSYEFSFEERTKRPPKNEANSLLSFVNMLLYAKIISQIYYTHLSPQISFLHQPSHRRFSLALDLSEIFKPIISERLFIYLITKKIVRKTDFIKQYEGIKIKENALRRILQEFENRLKSTVKHKTLKRKVSYQRLIRLECYKLEKHFLNIQKYKPLVSWW